MDTIFPNSYFWKEEQAWRLRMKMVQFLFMMLVQGVGTTSKTVISELYFSAIFCDSMLLANLFSLTLLSASTTTGFIEIAQCLLNFSNDSEIVKRMLESVDVEGDTVSINQTGHSSVVLLWGPTVKLTAETWVQNNVSYVVDKKNAHWHSDQMIPHIFLFSFFSNKHYF